MNFLLSVIISLAIFEATTAFTFYSSAPEDPNNFGKCIYNGEVLKKGIKTVEGCIEIICNEDGSFYGSGCSKSEVSGCTPGEIASPNSAYPTCCKKKWTCKSKTGEDVVLVS